MPSITDKQLREIIEAVKYATQWAKIEADSNSVYGQVAKTKEQIKYERKAKKYSHLLAELRGMKE
jgi:hypothetical protein